MDHRDSKWPPEINDYVLDIPMKISASFMPRNFNFDLPAIVKPNSAKYKYVFNAEKEAIHMANDYYQKKEEEIQRIKELNGLHEKKLQELERNSTSSNFNGLNDLQSVEVISSSNTPTSNPATTLPSPTGSSYISPAAVTATSIPTSPVKELSGVYGSSNLISSKVVSPSLPYPNKSPISGSIGATSNDISKTAIYNQFAEPYTIRQHHSVQNSPQHSGTITSSPLISSSSSEIAPSLGTTTTTTSTQDASLGILRPIPSQFNCDYKNNTRQEFIPTNRIDPADFESSSSSPFDDALLKAIDDKQELNRVFQHL